jgi:hypothetical protein
MSLPTEIWYDILLKLELKELYKMMRMSHYFYNISSYILKKRYVPLLKFHDICINESQIEELLTLKELKLYIQLCFLFKKDIFYYDRIKLTLFNTQIYKNYFVSTSLSSEGIITLVMFCPIDINKIEHLLSCTKINGKFIKIYHNDIYFCNNKVTDNINIFRKVFDSNGHVSYLLKGHIGL